MRSVRGGSTDQIFSFHNQRACSVHFPDQNNTCCLTLLSVSATGVKLQQTLPKPEHRRREFTCLQVCHRHCHLCFCPAVASSCHLPRTEQGAARTRAGTGSCAGSSPSALCPPSPEHRPLLPGHPSGLRWAGTRGTSSPRRRPAAGRPPRDPPFQPLRSDSVPQALWDDAIASKVCPGTNSISGAAGTCPRRTPEQRFPLVRATGLPGTRNPVSTQMMGFILL